MAKRGFTLIELIMATFLVAVAVVAVMGGIRSLGAADVKARRADLMQRLATHRLNALRSSEDLNSAAESGDFSEEGYSGILWSVSVQPSGIENLDDVKVTVTYQNEVQELSELIYVQPVTGGGAGAGATGAAGAGGQ